MIAAGNLLNNIGGSADFLDGTGEIHDDGGERCGRFHLNNRDRLLDQKNGI